LSSCAAIASVPSQMILVTMDTNGHMGLKRYRLAASNPRNRLNWQAQTRLIKGFG
jgi:hypothetical protein